MKRNLYYVLLVLFITYLASCSSTQNTTERKKPKGRDYSTYTNLADIIRRQPGVVVTGVGNNVTITIRGQNSFQIDTRPLFIIDNTEIGRDYARVNDAVNPANVTGIQVLKSYVETNRWGERGRNGIIIIHTINGQKAKKKTNKTK